MLHTVSSSPPLSATLTPVPDEDATGVKVKRKYSPAVPDPRVQNPNGQFKVGNPGRPPGVQQRKSWRLKTVEQIIQEQGINPLEARFQFMQRLEKEAEDIDEQIKSGVKRYRRGRVDLLTDNQIELLQNKARSLRFSADRIMGELARYGYAERKSMEVNLNVRTWADIARGAPPPEGPIIDVTPNSSEITDAVVEQIMDEEDDEGV